MTALRQFYLVYVALAATYTVLLLLSAHPDWSHNARSTTAYLGSQSYRTTVAINDQVLEPTWNLAGGTANAIGHRVLTAVWGSPAHRSSQVRLARSRPINRPVVVARVAPPARENEESDEAQLPIMPHGAPVARPDVATLPTPSVNAAPAFPHKAMTLAPATGATNPPVSTASLPPAGPPAAADIIRVTERLKENLTREMVDNFELFLYVSKADTGPWAQHMYVFQKQKDGDLTLLYNWPVSTGRERIEFNPEGRRLITETPPGYYELDPHRSYEQYNSHEWRQPMPYAMFFNWVKDGNETGLAIHAASGDDVAKLGRRASAGCIHLSEDNARTLFTLIRAQYRGLAPRFAIDRQTGTMSNDGILVHDADGHVQLADGYKVLVFIEDFGGENVVAALF